MIKFDPQQRICRDPATALFLTLGAVSAFSSIQEGKEQKKALNMQADQQREQARLAAVEAEEEATRREEERDRTLATQRMAFTANGVKLTPAAGSSIALMDETARQFNLEIQAVRRRGAAETNFGFREAQISENKGRAALLQGFSQAAGTASSTFVTGKKEGIF